MDNDRYIGKLLDDRYEILEVIGNGGMAVVYKARCRRLNRMVAVKILKDEFSQDKEFRDRFHAESQAVAMLSHPNIVSVYDVSTSEDSDYIVMELIEGITLKYYMEKKGVLNWKETLHFAMQIAKALEHAHSRGIVHRDIKPHNVMVLKNGSVKVADFGIAQIMTTGDTMAQEALGSVHYISPEQAKGSRVDCRSDVYSLGVVMYEMISGRVPYDGENPVSVVMQHINGQMQLPSALNPNTPKGLEQIILKAMARQPKDRYATATAMLYDMDEFRKNPTMVFAVPQVEVKGNPGQKQPRTEQSIAQKKTQAAPRKKPSGKKPQKKVNQTRSRVATIAITSCILAGLVAVVIVLLLLPSCQREPEEVKVPNLLGMTQEQLDALTDIQVNVLWDYNEEYPEGQVFAQEPAAGVTVKKGYTVSVSISRGSSIVRMPNLLGKTVEEAKEILRDLDLALEFESLAASERVDDIPEGCVVATEPAELAALELSQKIYLYYNPTTKKVPGLNGMMLDQAIAALEKAGFYQYKVKYQSNENPMNTVLGYDPTGDRGTDETINITVSAGTLKDLSGMTLEETTAYLDTLNRTLGFNLRYSLQPESSSQVEENSVIRTDPEAGTMLTERMRVIVCYSTGSKMVEVPDLRGMTAQEAIAQLRTLGFVNPMEKEVASPLIKGAVVGLSAQIGIRVDVSKPISVLVSAGDGLEDLSNKSLENAERYLSGLNLKLTVEAIPEKSDAAKQGDVIRTDPGAGQTVNLGQKITVYYCSGPSTAKLPDVEGKMLEEAKTALYQAGFNKLKVEYLGADEPAGTVLILSDSEYNTLNPGDILDTDMEILIMVAHGQPLDGDVVLTDYAFVIPGHDEAVEVSIYCGDELLVKKRLSATENTVKHTISGQGAKQYHIYIDGNYCNTETVVFENHE